MQTWHESDGLDWIEGDPLSTPPGGIERPALAGLVIGSGYAHQSVATLGIADGAALLLRRELSRPIETAQGVVQVDARVEVGPLETVIALGGGVGAVRAALTRLSGLLADPGQVQVPAEPLPAPAHHPWSGWWNELAVWFGVGPASLSARLNPAWDGSEQLLRDAIGAMSPGRGAPAVGFATELELVGGVRGAGGSLPPRSPLRWRDVGPASVRGTYANNLLSARVPDGAAGMAGMQLLARTVDRGVVQMAGAAPGLTVTASSVDGNRLLLVRAQAGSEGYDPKRGRVPLTQALDAFGGLADSTVAEEVERHRAATRAQPPTAVGLAAQRLSTGVRSDQDQRIAEAERLTVADVRAAVAEIHDHLLLGIGADEDPPDGFPLHDPGPAPEPDDAAQVYRTRIPVQGEGGDTHLEIRASPTAMSAAHTPLRLIDRLLPDGPWPAGRRQARAPEGQVSGIDLTRVAGRFDYGSAYTTMVDADNRWIGIPWPALQRPDGLRRLVDEVVTADQRRELGPRPDVEAQIIRRIRRRRVSAVVLVAVLLLLISMFFWPDSRGPQQEPTVATVAMGETVSLANGSTITVSDADWQEGGGFPHPTVLAQVRFCGGGETVQRGADADDRNYASDAAFDIGGIDAVTRAGMRPSGTFLAGAQLDEGQCTSGMVSIEVEVPAPVEGATVRYTNILGDTVDWTM